MPQDREQHFKDTYVAAFMASYYADNYSNLCATDHGHDDMKNHGIIEDAECMADYAWQAMLRMSNRMPFNFKPQQEGDE